MANVTSEPHYLFLKGNKNKILEFPVPVCKIGPLLIPFCGGFYFRVMPLLCIKRCLNKTLQRQDSFIYIHPWEIDSGQPKLPAPLYIKIIHNIGIKGAKRKLEKMLMNYSFSDPNRFGIGEYADEKCSLR
jgi:hypothetical protein